ncbi:MAG: hypothetical protein ACYC7E_17760 [Armatimonadota bacterium]
MHTVPSPRWFAIALLCLALSVAGIARADTQYRLTESLGHHWTAELISFPVTFKAGERFHVASVTADSKLVHFQVGDIARHPDGSVAAAQVYVFTDLTPKQSILFRTSGAAKDADLPKTDLRVSKGNGQVTLETTAGGVKLPLGEFAAPQVPAPYAGFRLASGRWIGGSQLLGNPGPTALSAKLVAQGPLFAEVQLTYSYPKEKSYTLTCRVIAGQPVALIREASDVEKGKNYSFRYDNEFKRFVQGRHGYKAAIEQSHWVRMSLGDFQPTAASMLTVEGTHAALSEESLTDPWLTTLFPWQSWHGGALALPMADARDGLGLMTLSAGAWVRPMENMGLVKRDGQELFVQWPINDGGRAWGLFFGPPAALQPTGEEPKARQYPGIKYPSIFHRARVKYGEMPLEKVKDWTLAWKDGKSVPNPVSINPPGKLKVVQERIAADPVLAKHAQGVINSWETLRKSEKNFPFTLNWVMTPDGVEDAYLATGKPQYARELYDLTLARLRYYTEQTIEGVGFHGYRSGHSYGMFHLAPFLVGGSRQADLLLGSPEVTPAEKADLRAQLAFFGCLFTDADYWPGDDIGKGTYNMYASRDGVLGVLGSVLAGHPQASAWQAAGAARMEDVLSHFIYPSGAMLEGMHYSGVTLDFNLPFMSMLKLAGGRDYFADERLKRGLRWYASCLPPVDKRFNRAYMPPFGYSHPTNTSQSVRWAVAAAMTAKTDPAFSQLMMRTWRQSGSFLTMVGGEAGYRSAFSLGLIDPSLPVSDGKEVVSAAWEGFGAVLRSHADTPLETYMAIPTGTPGGFRVYPNEGTFHLYAKGAPLCLRFGTRSFNYAGTMMAWMNNRITFDKRDECSSDTGKIREWATLSAGDLFTGEYRFTKLAARATLTDKEPGKMELSEPRIVNTKLAVGEGLGFFGDQQDVAPQTWRRQVLFVKDALPTGPNYFLIRDTFQATLPTDWNIWCLADDVKVVGNRATFTGKFGVDLDVFFAPGKKVVTGAWGPDWERQKVFQLQQDVNQGYFALLYPRAKDEPAPACTHLPGGAGIRVDLPNRVDWAFLSVDAVKQKTDEVEFTGRAGMVQRGEQWTRLTLLAGDRIALGDFALMHGRQVVDDVRVPTDGPISLSATLAPGPRLTGEYSGGPRNVVIQVPVAYQGLRSLLVDGKPATLNASRADTYSFALPAGEHRFEIGK